MTAEQALQRGAITQFKKLTPQLQDYPLYPYLRYEYLRTRLHKRPAEEINTFIDTFHDSPLSSRLHFRWIKKLAQNGRWKEIEQYYRPGNNVTLACYYRRALLKKGDQEAAFDRLEQLWLVGHSQPRACDPLFTAWHDAGFIDDTLAWQRIQLAMGKRKLTLTRYLTRFLSRKERVWANKWIEVHRKPSRILSTKYFTSEHPMRNTIIVHGLTRMARTNPVKTASAWQTTISARYPFSDDEISRVERAIGMAMALRNKPEALSWLAVLEEKPADQSLREWRVRTALNQQNWDAALAWLYQLNDNEQQMTRWQYWRARALEALGQQVEAEAIYNTLAMSRGYYSFLAADKLARPYRLEHAALLQNDELATNIEQLPGILRARELFILKRTVEARREWFHATQHMSEKQLHQAGQLAHRWGWHDRAILTIARTKHRDDLDVRFPLVHQNKIMLKASENNVDAALAFALIRQESAFTSDARSSAGAMGLMQLMPRTAKQLTRGTGIRIKNHMQLIDIDINLKLGMKHLGKVMKRFNNNPVLALAAYNAGQARVKRWIPDKQQVDADLWAETIPFKETRNYIQNIMVFTLIYEQHLGRPLTPLAQRMMPVGTAPPVITPKIDENLPAQSATNNADTIKISNPIPIKNNTTTPATNDHQTQSHKKNDISGIKMMQYNNTITLSHSEQEGI
ncbi:MAG: transglycosylase SLT domain-containing protein [Gammaproteobacteria bacterium]|nr:transglycosylase SLT domain-containing protein [Gammaproteobacteria bacterium]